MCAMFKSTKLVSQNAMLLNSVRLGVWSHCNIQLFSSSVPVSAIGKARRLADTHLIHSKKGNTFPNRLKMSMDFIIRPFLCELKRTARYRNMFSLNSEVPSSISLILLFFHSCMDLIRWLANKIINPTLVKGKLRFFYTTFILRASDV